MPSRTKPSFLPISALVALSILLFTLSGCRGQDEPGEPNNASTSGSEDMSSAREDMNPGVDLGDTTPTADMATPGALKVATFNASLFRQRQGELLEDLEGGQDSSAKRVAEVLQRVQPDVFLINEFDYDAGGEAAKIFAEQYLAQAQNGATPFGELFVYVPESNTGEHSGEDLDQNGQVVSEMGSVSYGNDAYGFGTFPGQYGMAIFSKYPIDTQGVRTFRKLGWSAMTDNLQPVDWYGEQAANAMRLSSKNHVDLPVKVGDKTLHLLVSHPTPPSFDGPEDRNGRRNHDEIRLWSDYLSVGESDGYIVDDAGNTGGLEANAAFVILGDLNSDPQDGGSQPEGITGLLTHPRVQDTKPSSEGAREAARDDGGANAGHSGDPVLDTADFSDREVGNLRVDYALPSKNLRVIESGVFWPSKDDPHAALARVSDHHLVWVEVAFE